MNKLPAYSPKLPVSTTNRAVGSERRGMETVEMEGAEQRVKLHQWWGDLDPLWLLEDQTNHSILDQPNQLHHVFLVEVPRSRQREIAMVVAAAGVHVGFGTARLV